MPSGAIELFDETTAKHLRKRYAKLDSEVDNGYGAVMLYLGIEEDAFAAEHAQHLQLYRSLSGTPESGRHIFVSLAGQDETRPDGELRAPIGQRTATVSTHVALASLAPTDSEERAQQIARIQQSMRETLCELAPTIAAHIAFELPGSPRTFARFTQRKHGAVGGVPRTVGLHNYTSFAPTRAQKGLYLVGDSYFPGQSALAAALGGSRAATALLA